MAFSALALQQQVRQAIRSLSGVTETVTYDSFVSVSTDRTDTVNDTAITATSLTVEDVVFTEYSQREIDGDAITRKDRKVLIPALNLSVTPGENDTITRADSSVWQVQAVSRDPAGALWVLQARQ